MKWDAFLGGWDGGWMAVQWLTVNKVKLWKKVKLVFGLVVGISSSYRDA